MKKSKNIIILLIIFSIILLGIIFIKKQKSGKNELNVQIDLGNESKKISQYIYGINQGGDLDKVTVISARDCNNRIQF